jgi:hypothetical protein
MIGIVFNCGLSCVGCQRGSLGMLFKTQSASVYGIDVYLVEVDVGSARMQDFNVVGLLDNAVKESRERINANAQMAKMICKHCAITAEGEKAAGKRDHAAGALRAGARPHSEGSAHDRGPRWWNMQDAGPLLLGLTQASGMIRRSLVPVHSI